jgi:hypothetical protein
MLLRGTLICGPMKRVFTNDSRIHYDPSIRSYVARSQTGQYRRSSYFNLIGRLGLQVQASLTVKNEPAVGRYIDREFDRRLTDHGFAN